MYLLKKALTLLRICVHDFLQVPTFFFLLLFFFFVLWHNSWIRSNIIYRIENLRQERKLKKSSALRWVPEFLLFSYFSLFPWSKKCMLRNGFDVFCFLSLSDSASYFFLIYPFLKTGVFGVFFLRFLRVCFADESCTSCVRVGEGVLRHVLWKMLKKWSVYFDSQRKENKNTWKERGKKQIRRILEFDPHSKLRLCLLRLYLFISCAVVVSTVQITCLRLWNAVANHIRVSLILFVVWLNQHSRSKRMILLRTNTKAVLCFADGFLCTSAASPKLVNNEVPLFFSFVISFLYLTSFFFFDFRASPA